MSLLLKVHSQITAQEEWSWESCAHLHTLSILPHSQEDHKGSPRVSCIMEASSSQSSSQQMLWKDVSPLSFSSMIYCTELLFYHFLTTAKISCEQT